MMPDVFSVVERSRIMAAVRSKHTTPERLVRSLLHRAGFRFRLHDRRLPGTPDIVFRKYKTVVEVRGCFWHQHGCRRGVIPATRRAWWTAKLRRNVERDARNVRALRRNGWRVIVVWECQTRDPEKIAARVTRLLNRVPATPLKT